MRRVRPGAGHARSGRFASKRVVGLDQFIGQRLVDERRTVIESALPRLTGVGGHVVRVLAHVLAQLAGGQPLVIGAVLDRGAVGVEHFDLAGNAVTEHLGNAQPGDGRRFMGRGIIQLTGRDNYTKYAGLTGLPLVENPGLAEVPETAVYIACLYWKRKGLNTLADADNGMQITRLINGGYNGIEDRAHRVAQAKAILA